MAKKKGGLSSLGIPEFQRSGLIKPLRGKRRKREIKAAQRLQFGGIKRQLRGEQRASQEQEHRLKSYFKQYKTGLTQQQQRTAGAYREAGETIGTQSQAAADYAEQLRQRLAQEESEDAARRGTSSVQREGSQTNVAAQLARMNAANILRGVTASQGAAQRTYFQKAKSISDRELIEQRLREQARRRSLGQELRETKKEAGALGVNIMAQQRGQERDFYLGLLGIAGSRAGRRLSKFQTKFGAQQTAKEATKQRRHESREAAKDRQAAGRGGGKEPLSPAEQRARAKQKRDRKIARQQAAAFLQSPPDKKSKKKIRNYASAVATIMHRYDLTRKEAKRIVDRYGMSQPKNQPQRPR